MVGPKRFELAKTTGTPLELEKKLRNLLADSQKWGIENRRIREVISRGELIPIYDERQLRIVIEP